MDSEPSSAEAGEPHNSFKNGLWWFVMVQAGLLVSLLPTGVVFAGVEFTVVTAALYAVAALPVGLALQAGMYALRRPEAALGQHPWSRYWEGWRLGWRQSLWAWAPVVVLVVGVLAASLAMPDDAIARPLVTTGLIIGGVAAVIAVGTLTVIATFSFRTRDVPRVALFGLGSKPFSTAGLIGVVFVVVALVALRLEAVLMLLMVLICYALLAITRPIRELIRVKLVAQPATPAADSAS